MKPNTKHKTSTAATSGAPEINRSRSNVREGQSTGFLTSKPTVAGTVPKGHEQRFEPAPIAEAEFIRLPSAKGRCRYTGLSRSGLVSVAKAAGAFVSCRLPGKVRGAALIDKAKLTAFLKGGAGHE
ncbi:MAG: hypothetical protein IPK22_13465 [Verrucomicrobiaceae bacterium]|nr:hypothetical protein [Verrucomicrobiaceae bacterium]